MAYAYANQKTTPARYARWVAAGIVLFPLSLTRVDFRSARRLIVGAHHASPAYAAFEDLSTKFETRVSPAVVALPALNTERVAARPDGPAELRLVTLAGLKLRRAAPAEVAVARSALAPVTKVDSPADMYDDPDAVNVTHAPPHASVAGVARRLVRRELAAREAAHVIESVSGTKIIVRGNEPAGRDDVRSSADAAQPATFAPALAAIDPAARAERAYWLDGRLEMTGGLAHLGPETDLVIKRTLDGRVRETGRIWVTEGKFEIRVERPTGLLVAELRLRDGRVLGRGQINLAGLPATGAGAGHAIDQRPGEQRIGDLRIELSPATETAAVRAISGYSHGTRKLAVRDARVEIQAAGPAAAVDDDGFAEEASLEPGSTYLARATAPRHWPSLVVGDAGEPRDVRLLSNQMVEALLDLNVRPGERRAAGLAGVVWGRVSDRDAAVTGARVELSGEYKPVYFNDLYLPDATMNETGANGLFAFVNVKPGVQAVRIRRRARAYPAQVFATEAGHVSYVESDLRDQVVSRFSVRDVLTDGSPVPAELNVVGTDAKLRTTGETDVRYDAVGESIMVEADAGPEFEVSRATVSGAPEHVPVPVVRREWLSGLYRTKQIAPVPDRGAVVGFVDGQDFSVEMTGGLLKERLPVVYFDARGAVIEGLIGVAGGGFAILNAPTGLQTVRIQPTQSAASFSRLVVAEPNLVQVMTWSPAAR